jgi:hypothetical protein
MTSPVYFVLLIVVGSLAVVGMLGLFLVGALLVWQTWALVKVNRIVGETLAGLLTSVKETPLALANAAKVMTELKEFQEGEVRLMREQVKTTRDLVATVEEFQAMLTPPGDSTPRSRRGTGLEVATEQDEIQREQRRKERGALGGIDLEAVGKQVGTV